MELRQIRYFIAVAESKTLTNAAKKLHIVQPALSANIKSLETELGVQLFERTRFGMELTKAGKTFLAHAYAISRQIETARVSVCSGLDAPEGSVSLGLPGSVGNVLSIELLKRVSDAYPKVKLEIEEGVPDNLIHAFEAGLLDLLIDFDANVSKRHPIEHLMNEELYFISAFSKDIQPGSKIEFKELAHYPLLVTGGQHGIGYTITNYATKNNIDITTLPSAGGINTTLKMVKAELGFAVLPWSGIYQDIEQNQLSARKVVNPSMHRVVSLLTNGSKPKSIAMSKVIEMIRRVVKDVYAQDRWRGELVID